MTAQIRYSIFYFAFNLSSGVTLAFIPLHASALGFSPMGIALISACSSLAMLFGGPGFTTLSHYHYSPRRILLSCSFAAVLVYLPLLSLVSFPAVMAFWLSYLLLNSATSVIVDSRAVRDSAAGEIDFERARTWGSIGFVCSLAMTGALIDVFGLRAIIMLGFFFVVLTHFGARLLLSRMPEQSGTVLHGPAVGDLRNIRGPLATLLLAVGLSWASHGAFYVYFSIYLKALGWSGTAISVSWNVGVIAEIILFIFFRRVLTVLSLRTIFRLSIVFAIIRWVVLALTADPFILVAIQALHAFTFGSLYLSSIRLVQELSPPHFRERGQGLLSGFSIGAGLLGGRLLFGACASAIPESADLYLLFWPAALVATLALAAAFSFRPHAP